MALTNHMNRGDNSSTFTNNMSLPVHRWFRFSAGFSAEWVKKVIIENKKEGRKRLLDPFVGSGTSVIVAEETGIQSIGIESHPFIYKISQAKLSWSVDINSFNDFAYNILQSAKGRIGTTKGYPELIYRCYPDEVLKKLDALRTSLEEVHDSSKESKLTWLILTSILRECTQAGTANWQYLLPNKKKKHVIEPFEAFERKIEMIREDIYYKNTMKVEHEGILKNEDSRESISVNDDWADLIITSPPYANNYDYADATRLELSFFKEISQWSDLQSLIRPHLIRACTQHVASISKQTDDILNNRLLSPISNEIWDATRLLDKERLNHGGKKPYHTMIASYFLDLAKVWQELRRVSMDGVKVCFVIGDSAPYGIYIPVDEWLARLAIEAGFKEYHFEKIRDRNIKWKNRKHSVPLKEGRLWING